jgi:hypothetical protein
MKLYYFQSSDGNFGDDLNAWLWPKLLGETFFDENSANLLVGIGTLLNHRIPKAPRTIVFGSGFGYGSLPAIDATWTFLCVRGPKTAEALHLPAELAITDPALLIYPFTKDLVRPQNKRVGYIPHCDSAAAGDWHLVATEAGLHYIDPRWSVDRVMAEIGQCEYVVTEAMHGAIFSDAMRVPWVAASAYSYISAFKWQDWCASMELEYRPEMLPSIWSGDEESSPLGRAKSGLKRTLQSAGLFSANWTPPAPKRSSARTVESAIAALRLAATVTPTLSRNDLHAQKLEALWGRLARLKEMQETS